MNNFVFSQDPLLYTSLMNRPIPQPQNEYELKRQLDEAMAQYQAISQQTPPSPPKSEYRDYLGEIDTMVRGLDEDIIIVLNSDMEYLKINDDLQKMIQEEMLKSIRWKINSNPKAIDKMDRIKELIAVAKKNITLQKLSGRVSCVSADALDAPAAFLGKFDMIVSNPPYITTKEMSELPDSVANYEPHLALHGGEDGLDFYRNIARNYKAALKPGGYLCFEFGMGQGDDVCEILEMNGYTVLERSSDYNARERAVIAQLGRKED